MPCAAALRVGAVGAWLPPGPGSVGGREGQDGPALPAGTGAASVPSFRPRVTALSVGEANKQ